MVIEVEEEMIDTAYKQVPEKSDERKRKASVLKVLLSQSENMGFYTEQREKDGIILVAEKDGGVHNANNMACLKVQIGEATSIQKRRKFLCL
jgi:hypothetical protein